MHIVHPQRKKFAGHRELLAALNEKCILPTPFPRSTWY